MHPATRQDRNLLLSRHFLVSSLVLAAGCGRTFALHDAGSPDARGAAGASPRDVGTGAADVDDGGNASADGTAGTAGTTGGTTGDSGAAGGPGGDAGPADCFDLSRAPTGRFDFRVVGSGFDAYDGETARAVVDYVNHVGYGLGETTIRNGSFEIALPKTNEPYTGYAVYIDRGNDDACTVNVDPFFQMVSGGVYQDVNWEITPQTTFLRGLEPCNIDGIFDLTQPLPCPG